MGDHVTPVYGFIAPDGDDPIKQGDDKLRALVDALEAKFLAITASARVTITADQSSGGGVFDPIEWSSEVWDDANFWDVSNPARMTAPATGKYHLTAGAVFDLPASVTDVALCFLRNSDSDVIATSGDTAVDGTVHARMYLNCETLINLSAGDYVRAGIYAPTAGNIRHAGLGNKENFFCIRRVS